MTVAILRWYLVDLFFTAYAAEIHGTKWDDSNGNAVFDFGESGVQGVSICYYGTIPYILASLYFNG